MIKMGLNKINKCKKGDFLTTSKTMQLQVVNNLLTEDFFKERKCKMVARWGKTNITIIWTVK